MLPASRAFIAEARAATRNRAIGVCVVLAAATAFAFCLSISIGDFPVPLADVVPAIAGGADPGTAFIVRELRLPRALVAVLVGVAFGLSGAMFQALARNPLASPDVLGVTSGASLAAVFCLTVLHASRAVMSLGAFLGGLVTALVIYVLAYRRGLSSYRLVLVGIGIGAVANALISYLWTRAHLHDAASATVWLSGSLNGLGWESVTPLALGLLVLVPAAMVLARPLGLLQLGDDTARGIGLPLERARLVVLVVAVALAGVAVAAAGPVAFVAFVSAPIARRLTRSPGPSVVPSALLGALLVAVADLIGRRLLGSTEVPVGLITGVIGAPYLLWLLATVNRIGRGA